MKTFVPWFFLLALAGCAREDRADAVRRFRSSLAIPELHPVREGIEVDEVRLMAAVERFAIRNRSLLEERFEESLLPLPSVDLPGAPEHRVVASLAGEELREVQRPFRLYWALYPEAERLVQLGLGMLFPPMVIRRLGLDPSRVASWMSFLNVARPALGYRRLAPGRLALVADYGERDILVIDLAREDLGWEPREIVWFQRAGVSTATGSR